MNSQLEDRDVVSSRIAAYVSSWGEDGCFDELALELFRYQYVWNAPYRRYCDSIGANPKSVRKWEEAPAAPGEAFRTQVLSCSPALTQAASSIGVAPPKAEPGLVFLSSGTTVPSARSAHWMDAPAIRLYELSLRTAFERLAHRAAGLPIISLAATSEQAPTSSLSFMLSALCSRPQGGLSYWLEGGPDLAGAELALRRQRAPVLLFTTAFGLVELLEFLSAPVELPTGSFVIETGGFKGRRRAVDRESLYAAASEGLGVPEDCIGAEYGMCEMASQFYDSHLRGAMGEEPNAAVAQAPRPRSAPVKIGPPWVRTRVIDPALGQPAALNSAGLLVHYDLCNLNSVMGVATLDVGVAADSGHGFILQGRATPDVETSPGIDRGCSLTVEEWRDAQ